jgi:hypothetical protein
MKLTNSPRSPSNPEPTVANSPNEKLRRSDNYHAEGEFGEFSPLGSEARTSFQRWALVCSPAATLDDHVRPGGWAGPGAIRHFRNLHTLSDSGAGCPAATSF